MLGLDLYTFDKDQESAEKTYNEVCATYERLLNRLELVHLKGIYENLYMYKQCTFCGTQTTHTRVTHFYGLWPFSAVLFL